MTRYKAGVCAGEGCTRHVPVQEGQAAPHCVDCSLKVGDWHDAQDALANAWAEQCDPVDHPEHYQSEDGIECIDATRAALGLEGFVAHCRGTAIKYAWRSGKKAKHAEDLRKAAWYLTRAAEALDDQA